MTASRPPSPSDGDGGFDPVAVDRAILPGFRAAVADHLSAKRSTPATADGILATDSAASALFLVARALRPASPSLGSRCPASTPRP